MVNKVLLKTKSMKRIVRISGLFALAVLAFTACKKDEPQKVVTFTATIAQTSPETKTHSEAYENRFHLVWDDGDKIKVINPTGDADCDFEVTGIDEKSAVFYTDDPDKVDFLADLEYKDYTAFYPNAVVRTDGVEFSIPAEQEYKPSHNFATNSYPMVGFNEGTNFVFQSNAGFLYLTFKAPANHTMEIDRIVLTANEDIAGKLVYSKDALSYVLEGESNSITLKSDVKLSVTDDQPVDATFILPEGTLANGFNVMFYDGETLVGDFSTQRPNPIVSQLYVEMPCVTLTPSE